MLKCVVSTEDHQRTCQNSLRLKLQSIFEEFENNRAICSIEDLRQSLSPIFNEMFDQREAQIMSRIEERYNLVAQMMETVKEISNNGRDCSHGPPGPPGPPGQGLMGPSGPPGAKGSNGETGPAGPPGIVGRDGLAGVPGTNGAPGEKGSRGEKGDLGSTGDRGLPGTKGSKGVNGVPGTNGNQGPRGLTGEPGGKGDQGSQAFGDVSFAAFNNNGGSGNYFPKNEFLTFNEILVNNGGAFDGTTFTAPKENTYIFGFSSEIYDDLSNCRIQIFINDAYARDFINYQSSRFTTFSFTSIEKLNADDKVQLYVKYCELIASPTRRIYFYGFALNSL